MALNKPSVTADVASTDIMGALGGGFENIYVKALVNAGNWHWDQTKTGGAVHWYLDPLGWTPAQYTSMREAVEKALDGWASVANITFTEASRAADAEIVVHQRFSENIFNYGGYSGSPKQLPEAMSSYQDIKTAQSIQAQAGGVPVFGSILIPSTSEVDGAPGTKIKITGTDLSVTETQPKLDNSGNPVLDSTGNPVLTTLVLAHEGQIETYVATDGAEGGPGNLVSTFNADGSISDHGYQLIVHELGHALGLDHPHNKFDSSNPANSVVFPGVDGSDAAGNMIAIDQDAGDHGLNSTLYSVMSYQHDSGTDAFGRSFGDPPVAGPMAFDIAAMQALYGVNTTYHAGADTYTLYDPADPRAGAWQSIWDAGGTDEIVYNGDANAVIDLSPARLDNSVTGGGMPSYTYQDTLTAGRSYGYGFTIANGAIIENARGGSGNDELMGNDARNTLIGRDGNDTLVGGVGADTMEGGRDNDTYYVDDVNDVVLEHGFTGASAFSTGDMGGVDEVRVQRTLSTYELAKPDTGYGNIENLTFLGMTENFTGTGNSLGNVITGGGGDDTLDGAGGTDTIDGAGGNDTVVFNGLRSQYQIWMLSDTSAAVADQRGGAPDGTDIISNVEFVRFADGTVNFSDLVDHAPVVSGHDATIAANSTAPISSLFAAHDQDGDGTITQYMFMDGGTGGGHLELDGVELAALTWIPVDAAKLESVKYVDGSTAGSETLYAAAFDGKNWSENATLTATTAGGAPVYHAPVVTGQDTTVAAGGIVPITSVFSAHDLEGDNTITQYMFMDGGSGGGHLELDGVELAALTWIPVDASKLDSVKYVGGSDAGSETLYAAAFDGKDWSGNSTATMDWHLV